MIKDNFHKISIHIHPRKRGCRNNFADDHFGILKIAIPVIAAKKEKRTHLKT